MDKRIVFQRKYEDGCLQIKEHHKYEKVIRHYGR